MLQYDGCASFALQSRGLMGVLQSVFLSSKFHLWEVALPRLWDVGGMFRLPGGKRSLFQQLTERS